MYSMLPAHYPEMRDSLEWYPRFWRNQQRNSSSLLGASASVTFRPLTLVASPIKR